LAVVSGRRMNIDFVQSPFEQVYRFLQNLSVHGNPCMTV
jgi:hypothetical protein